MREGGVRSGGGQSCVVECKGQKKKSCESCDAKRLWRKGTHNTTNTRRDEYEEKETGG